MAKKDKDKIKVEFIGNNAVDVTGSMTLITYNDKKILLECGIVQSSNWINDFKTNSKPFKGFKPKELNYVFALHNHGDHIFLIPKLAGDGFRGEIITTHETKQLMRPMLLNSAQIIAKDAIVLKREPFYFECDVHDTMEMTVSYDFNKVIWLDEEIGFKFLHNSHVIGAAQLELYIKRNNVIETILYTSDMGKLKSDNHYVKNLEKCKKARLVISECTYGGQLQKGKKNRDKDLEKIKTVVQNTCIENKGKVLIPVFAFARSMEILTNIYKIFAEDSSFSIPIICDSPLLYEMMTVQRELLVGEDKELFEKVVSWQNVKFVKSHLESKALMTDKTPCVILSSAGMLDKGRSLQHLKSIISRASCHILFCGYCGPGTLGRKIMDGQKNVKIEGKNYKCSCNITTLTSFSSHIPHEDLLKYLSSINCEKIALVHGETVNKLLFKDALEKEISAKDGTTKVLAVAKGTVVTL